MNYLIHNDDACEKYGDICKLKAEGLKLKAKYKIHSLPISRLFAARL
jgi:hypothetical protein